MPSRGSRRSISFELLANDSPGDGESAFNATENSQTVEEKADRPRRKRRKSKSRKAMSDTLGALSDAIRGAIGELNGDPVAPDISSHFSDSALNELMSTREDEALGDEGMDSVRILSDPPKDSLRGDGSPLPDVKKQSHTADVKQSFSLKSLASVDPLLRPVDQIVEDGFRGFKAASRDTTSLEPQSNEKATEKNPGGEDFPSTNGLQYSAISDPKSFGYFANNYEKSSRMPPPRGSEARQSEAITPHVASVNGGTREPVFPLGSPRPLAELRQRPLERSVESTVQENGVEAGKGSLSRAVSLKWQQRTADPSYLGRVDEIAHPGYRTPSPGRPPLATFATPQLTEWDRLMTANSEYPATVDLSPIRYLRGEVERGSTLEHHTSAGIEQKRERVYNTMFHVPWRCELLIDVGFFVCLDSFLSLFTVMPARIVMFTWQRLVHWRQFQRPYAAELSDFSSLIVLVMGVAVLQQADISFIYHYIRGQATIKLYVVFNVLEIFDKLCQSFGGDVLQVLINSAVAVGDCPSDRLIKEWAQFCLDQGIAIFSFWMVHLLALTSRWALMHSLIIMSQAITVSAAINSQNNALLTLLISNNFAEIKSNVFKRLGKENLHKMAYHDTVERFHIMAHLLFVLAQNFQNSEDAWVLSFAYNAGMVLLCEILVDVIKHAFLAKFNEIKPAAYSEFLQALCKQTLNSQSHEVHKTLLFVPLAPACVVLRVLIPLYATFLPAGPFWRRWIGILFLGGGTYVILLALKILVGLGLQMHAVWYLKRCRFKEGHPHAD